MQETIYCGLYRSPKCCWVPVVLKGLDREPTVKDLHKAQAKDMEKNGFPAEILKCCKSHIHPPWIAQHYLSELEEKQSSTRHEECQYSEWWSWYLPCSIVGKLFAYRVAPQISLQKLAKRVCIKSCAMNNNLLMISSNHFLAVWIYDASYIHAYRYVTLVIFATSKLQLPW